MRASGGFTLLEVSIAVVLAAMVMTSLLWWQAQNMRTQIADSQAQILVTLNNAVNAYEANNYNALSNAQGVTGVANAYAPSIVELTTLGLLTNGFSTRNLYGGGYQVSLARTPTGCSGATCNISGYTTLTTPILDGSGREDDSAAGEAMLQAGGDAGISTNLFPGTVNGAGGAWSMTNPMGSIAGILTMRNGYAASGFSQFLRRDGSLPMTGSLNMNGQSITNANTVGATTVTSANISNSGTITTGNLAAQNTISAPNGSITNLSTSTLDASQIWTGNLTASGTTTTNYLSAQNANVSGNTWSGSATTGGRQTVGEYVQLNGTAAVGAGCFPNGLVAQSGSGVLLSCVNGIWHSPLASAGIRYVFSGYGNVANPTGGYPDVGYAQCNSNEIVIGGGASCQDGANGWVTDSYQQGNGWIANCYGHSPSNASTPQDTPAEAMAVCLTIQ